ncbi:hypothetical protein, partial [Streptomyces sp. NPDC003660]
QVEAEGVQAAAGAEDGGLGLQQVLGGLDQQGARPRSAGTTRRPYGPGAAEPLRGSNFLAPQGS